MLLKFSHIASVIHINYYKICEWRFYEIKKTGTVRRRALF